MGSRLLPEKPEGSLPSIEDKSLDFPMVMVINCARARVAGVQGRLWNGGWARSHQCAATKELYT